MIASLSKALDVLELFSSSEPRLTLTEVASRLGFPKSTAHSILNTLAMRGYVERTSDGRYALGTAIMPLTQAVRVNVEVRDRAAPLLRALANECHESVYLGVPDRDRVLYLYAIESPQRLLARTAVGDRACLHCTALGKAMLARLCAEQGPATLERLELRRYTEHTITDQSALRAELAETDRRGYATDREEHEQGVYCVAAAIVGEQGQLIGACSVSGTAEDAVLSYARQVMATALEISRRMGYVPQRLSVALAEPVQAAPSRGNHHES